MTATSRPQPPARRAVRDDRGQLSIPMGGAFLLLIALAALLFDPGMTIAARVQALDAAQAAARAGADQLDLDLLRATGELRIDPDAARQAAVDFLAQAGIEGGTVAATPDQVTVTISQQRPTVMLGLVGVDTLPVQVNATAVPRTDELPPPA